MGRGHEGHSPPCPSAVTPALPLFFLFPFIQILLAAGASVDVRDEDGALPLHDGSAGGALHRLHSPLSRVESKPIPAPLFLTGYAGIVALLLQAAEDKNLRPSLLSVVDMDGDTVRVCRSRQSASWHTEMRQAVVGREDCSRSIMRAEGVTLK